MRAKQRHQARKRQRLDDEHVCSGRVGIERHDLRRRFELLERAGEAERPAGDRGAAGIGVEFTRPRDRRLDQHRRDRGQDKRREQHDRILPFTIVAAAAKEHREARNHHYCRSKRRGDRAD